MDGSGRFWSPSSDHHYCFDYNSMRLLCATAVATTERSLRDSSSQLTRECCLLLAEEMESFNSTRMLVKLNDLISSVVTIVN